MHVDTLASMWLVSSSVQILQSVTGELVIGDLKSSIHTVGYRIPYSDTGAGGLRHIHHSSKVFPQFQV